MTFRQTDQRNTLGLVGESGSGKTTLGRAILGLAPVTQGKVEFLGEDISHARRKDRQRLSKDIQVVFQDPYTSLNPSMEIGQILAEPLQIQGMQGDGKTAGKEQGGQRQAGHVQTVLDDGDIYGQNRLFRLRINKYIFLDTNI
jgi:ABC-type glutathione transport system ATPase component